MPPAAFLPVLEESGLIVPVGCWVMREAVRQMQVWQMLYGRDLLDWVSINVSARQFNDPSLLLATLGEINDSGFPLDRLKIEITELAVMRNPDRHPRRPQRAAGARHPHRDRRFRHRLFGARLRCATTRST